MPGPISFACVNAGLGTLCLHEQKFEVVQNAIFRRTRKSPMTTNSMTTDESADMRRACESALDELTASLTQVMKAVNKVHRTVKKLNDHIESRNRLEAFAETRD